MSKSFHGARVSHTAPSILLTCSFNFFAASLCADALGLTAFFLGAMVRPRSGKLRFQDRAMQIKRCGVVVAQCSTLIVVLQLCFLQGANARGPLHCGEFTRDVWDESKQHLKHIPERCRHLQLEAKGGQIGRRVAELLSANGEQSPSRWHTAVAAHLALPAVCSGSWTHSSCRPMALRVTWVGRSSRVCRTDSPTSEASVPAPQ